MLYSPQVSILNGSLETMKTFIGEQVGLDYIVTVELTQAQIVV